MDISRTPLPTQNPLFRPVTAPADSTQSRGKDSRADSVRPDIIWRDPEKLRNVDPLRAPPAPEETLKPYGTLMLPYRGDSVRVSVLA